MVPVRVDDLSLPTFGQFVTEKLLGGSFPSLHLAPAIGLVPQMKSVQHKAPLIEKAVSKE